METEIRIGAVSYLNTLPLLHGLRNHPAMRHASVTTDYPARIAEALLHGHIDLGFVPVAVIPRLSDPHLVSDVCIGCDGPVASVAIFGDRPIEDMHTIWLDYQSRTSAVLSRILLRDHWRLYPQIRPAHDEGYLNQIGGDAGGLVIGDRAFRQAGRSPYMYDLGQAWKEHTGLPFVFATWVANRPLDPHFIAAFNEANAAGLRDMDTVIRSQPDPPCNLRRYYTENMSYPLDDRKREGLNRFLHLLASL